MLTSLNTFNPAGSLLSLSRHCVETISHCGLSNKIKDIAVGCFKHGTSAYLCLFGTLELSQSIMDREAPEWDCTINKIVTASKAYFRLHGGLLLGSSLFSLANALHECGILNISGASVVMNAAANALFLGANILALKENIRLIQVLRSTDWLTKNIDDEELHWMKQSAFFGFASNLGYIITTASLLFNGATAFTLLVAIFSCVSGGMKTLYDFSTWAREQGLI